MATEEILQGESSYRITRPSRMHSIHGASIKFLFREILMHRLPLCASQVPLKGTKGRQGSSPPRIEDSPIVLDDFAFRTINSRRSTVSRCVYARECSRFSSAIAKPVLYLAIAKPTEPKTRYLRGSSPRDDSPLLFARSLSVETSSPRFIVVVIMPD